MTAPDPLLEMAAGLDDDYVEVCNCLTCKYSRRESAILRAAAAVIESARLRGTYTHHGRDTRIEDCPTCIALAAYDASCKKI